ncbi:MAG: thiol:disulfide interchange protein DsbA/DsbL, partial [Lysobacterales bacterium]
DRYLREYKMKKILIYLVLLSAAALMLSAPVHAQSGSSVSYQEGLHYFLIEEGPIAPEGSPELVEIFSYLCTHCNTFEPYINSWKMRNADNVKFTRIPVVFGRKAWELYARAYVTAQMMGLGDDAHAAMMDKLWKEKAMMRSMEDLAAFYSNFGVDSKTFLATSKSFAVDARMRKEQRLVQTYGVRATPTLVLNGKYRIAGNAAVPSFDVMLDVVDYLIAAEAE